jgi:hypothetical protein
MIAVGFFMNLWSSNLGNFNSGKLAMKIWLAPISTPPSDVICVAI